MRKPYFHPDRYPYFNENDLLTNKIRDIKDNVARRIKLLYEKCLQKIGCDRTIKELEKPDKVGNSLASIVCRDFSQKECLLFDWLMDLDIKPNTISMGNLMTPFFREPRVVDYLLKKGVSPYIHYEEHSEIGQATTWRCQMDDFCPNFERSAENAISDESQAILENLTKEQSLCQCENPQCSKPKVYHSVCFSPLDLAPYFKAGFTENTNMVPFNCLDARISGNMYDFFYHDISMVFKTKWNGQDAVMKCRKYIPKFHHSVNMACNHLIKILTEFSEKTDRVVAPLGYFRQQYLDYEANDVELDEKFREVPANTYQAKKQSFRSSSKVLNIDVLVYPRMDGNLRQLKTLKEDKLTAEELRKGLVKSQLTISLNFMKS